MDLGFSERRMGKGNPWLDEEVKVLINICAETNIQEQFDGAVRNKAVFQGISKHLNKVGYDKDCQQCRANIKNLKALYKESRTIIIAQEREERCVNFSRNLMLFSASDLLLNHL